MTQGPDSLEHLLSCQVCFHEFREDGEHIPRLLPCTHTLCEVLRWTTDSEQQTGMSRM